MFRAEELARDSRDHCGSGERHGWAGMSNGDIRAATRRSIQRHKTADRRRRFLRTGLFLAVLGYVPPTASDAATVSTTFLVTANIAVTCTIAATQLDFGDYDPLGANLVIPLNGQSQITVTCTRFGAWVVGLDQGQAPGATVLTRRMLGPGFSSLLYGLFSDVPRSVNWGNTIGVNTVSGIGTGGPQIVTVYGQVPAGQNGTAGGYSDTITATITF